MVFICFYHGFSYFWLVFKRLLIHHRAQQPKISDLAMDQGISLEVFGLEVH